MDPNAAAINPAAALPDPAAQLPAGPNNNAPPAIAAPAAIPPPSFDIDFETATTTIGTLPSLHPRPSHANIRALERVLFERLETLQSSQSEEWGFRGLAEQPAEYALKSASPWINAPNPGPHRPIGLNAQATRDAEATYDAEKAAWQAQATVTRAINAALNVAVPKAFRRNSAPTGGNIIGTTVYRSNHDPRDILLALRTVYGTPSPAERNANDALFAAPWNPAEPIETYFDRLEDCYVAAIIAMPPYTIEQMMTKAIMAIQLTGLYSQALIEWHALPPATKTWDTLKAHFTTAYIVREQSGTGTTTTAGYHSLSNVIGHDDALTNIESTLSAELEAIHLANNVQQQSNTTALADLRAALAATQQQLANYANAPRATPQFQLPPAPPMPPAVTPMSIPPTLPPAYAPLPPAYTPMQPTYAPAAQRYRGQRSRVRTQYQPPGTRTPTYAPHPLPQSHIPGAHPPLPGGPVPGSTPHMQHMYAHPVPPVAAPTPYGQAPNRPRGAPPNPNKRFNNHNYCYSCGFDVPAWHTSATCPAPNSHHQAGCTRENVAHYAANGHNISRRAAHKTVMPINPPPHLA